MDIISDCNMSDREALADHPDRPAPPDVRERLRLLALSYWSFDGRIHRGQIVVHEHILDQTRSVFADLLAHNVPISKLVPVSAYDWDDEQVMQANVCSAYNYRPIAGSTVPSLHAFGLAIDINPLVNPWMKGDQVQPAGAYYDPSREGTLTSTSKTVEIFKSHGFFWGGDWLEARGLVDYQHFDVNPYDDRETILRELRAKGVIP